MARLFVELEIGQVGLKQYYNLHTPGCSTNGTIDTVDEFTNKNLKPHASKGRRGLEVKIH